MGEPRIPYLAQGGFAPYRCDLYMYVPRHVTVRDAMTVLGTLNVTPSRGGSISSPELQLWCSGERTCTVKMTTGLAIRYGRVFKLAARPDPGFKFVGWGGICAPEKNRETCTLSINRERDFEITASFEPVVAPAMSKRE